MTKDKRKAYWEEIGEKYRLTWVVGARNYISRLEEGFIQKSISLMTKNNLSALDLGCGTGRVLSFLSKNPQVKTITAVDGSRPMVTYVKNKFKKDSKITDFVAADVSQKLPFKDGSFDLITTLRAIKYNQNWERILGECHRLLKNGGQLIFDMPNQNSLNLFSRCEIPIYKTSQKHLVNFLSPMGFKIVAIKGGPALPGFIYDHLNKNGALIKIVIRTERIIKKFAGETFLSRYLYFSCSK